MVDLMVDSTAEPSADKRVEQKARLWDIRSDKLTVDLVGTTDYNLETHSPDVDLVPTLAHLSSGNGSPAVNLNLPPSQAGVQYDVNINNNTDDEGSFCDPSTSTTTSPKTSASFVTSSLTNRVSLLSLSDESTVGMAKRWRCLHFECS